MAEERQQERESRQLFCRLITPEGIVFDDEADLVIANIADGEIGVLVDHSPLVSSVEAGAVRITHDDERQVFATSDGFFKVSENLVQILVEEVVRASEIDTEEAGNRVEEAERELSELPDDDERETERTRAALERRRRMGENLTRVAREYGDEG